MTQSLLDTGAGEHPGLDIAVAADEYVRAAGAGRVDVVAEDEVYGRYVELDHGGDLRSRYAHNGRIFVRPGARVRRNQVLALSGSTGRSTAPHLHFEILRGGHPVDPTTFVTRP